MLVDSDSAGVVSFIEWIAHIRLHYPLLCCSDHLPCALQHAKRAKTSLKEFYGRVFSKMPFRPCISGCGRYLAPGDGHDRCLSCLGIEHAEAAFVDESCPHCRGMTVAGLRTRLRFLQRGGVPVPLPRSRVPPGGHQGGATSGSSRAGLTVTVRNSPPKTARAPPVTGTSLPVELPRERLALPIEGGYRLYPLALPPTIGCRSLHWRVSQTNPEMMVQYRCHPPGGQRCRIRIRKWWLCLPGPLRVLGSSGGLHRVPNPQGWMIFLGVARAGSQGPTPVPFFPEMHDELTGTWTAPFTARNHCVHQTDKVVYAPVAMSQLARHHSSSESKSI